MDKIEEVRMGIDITFDEQVLFINNCGTLGIAPRKLLAGFVKKVNTDLAIQAAKKNSEN